MKFRWVCWMLVGALMLLTPAMALATNGTNLIGIGPVSRAMGGVGIAHPQDAIGAVFSNPAAMCFGAFCPSSEVEFAGTLFMPTVNASITAGNQTFSAKSEGRVYPIPAMGVSFNFPELPKWRFGLGAYGISGLGVNYKGTSIDQPAFAPFGGNPLAAGTYSDLMIMKFAPSAAYQVNDWLSLGAALNIDYSTLDLGQGNGANYAWGAQLGIIVKPHEKVSLGLTYITPQAVNYRNVAKLDFGNSWDSLTLESPNNLGIGIAYEPIYRKLLFELDVKWLNWSGAQGYSDFGWKDQIVVGIGAQYRPMPKLALRMGYNYGNNPLKGNQNFNGNEMISVQGKAIPRYYYETFRVIGFPAITEHHLTLGASYDVTDRFTILAGFVHSFSNTVSSTGTFAAQATTISSSLYENAIDFGLTWRF
jgi:long-chain fatty acid transport protein